jgi:predicted dinucleotide-binding enzyme
MKIGVLGTGIVAQLLAQRSSEAGHEVTFGSRDPSSKNGLAFPVASLEDVVAANGLLVNATPGSVSLGLFEGIGSALFTGKIIVDVANAITPAFELVYPNSSLAEKLQAALPGAYIVKSLNTAAMLVMTEPSALPPSSVFVSGDDDAAKKVVIDLLSDIGWPRDAIVDLGGIKSARGPEHYFLMFATLMSSLRTPKFNIRLVI